MPEYDARVGQQRGEGLFAVELPVTPAVGRGDLPVGAQHAFQLFGAERRQLQGQLRGLAGVTRQGRSGDFGRIVFGHRFGAGKEYLHGCGSKLDVLPLCRLRKAGERDERRHRELGREQVWTGMGRSCTPVCRYGNAHTGPGRHGVRARAVNP